MKQENNDIVLSVTTEWTQYETRMNFDVSGDELVRQFANLMRAMSFTSYTVVESLREVADEMDEDMKTYNKFNNEEDEYAAAN